MGDTTLWYEASGAGHPLLQIHGSVIGHTNFALASPHLAQSFRVIDFDQRGFGESDHPREGYSIERWADDAAGLLEALGIRSAHVHGTSMGGLVAIALAARHPDVVSGLVLDCTLARFDVAGRINVRVREALLSAFGWGEEFWRFLAIQDFSRSFVEGTDFPAALDLLRSSAIAQNVAEVAHGIAQALEVADVVPLLPNVLAPTLVMLGERDILTPYEMGVSGAGARVICERIGGAQLATVPGVGHINLFEAPELSASIIREFLTPLAIAPAL